MDREETRDRTECHEGPDAERSEERLPKDGAAGRYDGEVLEELEAHRFFHPPSVRWYRSFFTDRHLGEGHDLGDVEFLHERGLVVESGDRLAPTRAAVLVFGRARYVRQALSRPVVDCQFIGAGYDEGPPERHWTDRVVVEENLLQAWLIVAERYMRHAEHPFSIDMRTLRRDDHPPGYPSFREASINQLIHQDYRDRGRTAFIRFYRDRTVFWNPGEADAPTAELLDRTAKEVRNPLIAAAFRGIGLARQAGTGIRAIFRDWRRLGNDPPVIRNDKSRKAFELVLVREKPLDEEQLGETPQSPAGSDEQVEVGGRGAAAAGGNRDANKDSDQVGPVRPDLASDHGMTKLTARQRAIIAACEVPRSLTELMELAGVSHRSHFRSKHLKPLLAGGIVRMTRPDRPRSPRQRYVLTEARLARPAPESAGGDR